MHVPRQICRDAKSEADDTQDARAIYEPKMQHMFSMRNSAIGPFIIMIYSYANVWTVCVWMWCKAAAPSTMATDFGGPAVRILFDEELGLFQIISIRLVTRSRVCCGTQQPPNPDVINFDNVIRISFLQRAWHQRANTRIKCVCSGAWRRWICMHVFEWSVWISQQATETAWNFIADDLSEVENWYPAY